MVAPDFRLRVNVYRLANEGDCTNGGLTSQFDSALIVGEGYAPGTARADCPAFYLRERHGRVHAYPADIPEGAKGFTGWMFGGNFLYTTDSRFPQGAPIHVHDRRETWAQNDRLSSD